MNRQLNWITIGFLLFFSPILYSYELGAWYKRAPEIPHALNTRFQPSFLILKAAIFSTDGSLKVVGEPDAWKKVCDQNYKLTGWITHRLKKSEKLSNASGEKLAQNIAKQFSSTCMRTIELDIEPLTGEEEWLSPFLAKIKQTLAGSFEVRVALPFWKKENAQKILEVTDGIDLMLYDSGLKTKDEYAAFLKQNLDTAKELLTHAPEKSVLVGIPAYHERTALHVDNIENIGAFLAVLKARSLAENSKICTGHIKMALYAGWTLSPEDRNTILELKSFLDEICKKDK